jgi:hypothetical protein
MFNDKMVAGSENIFETAGDRSAQFYGSDYLPAGAKETRLPT